MPNAKILIVEDEGIEALDMQHRLESLGYTVSDIVSTGEEAVKKAGETRPDLILMDIMLQGEIDGVTAAEQIHARYDIPFIYLTAYADENTLQRAKITAPHGYIVKPFQERELHITIDMALYKHKMERKLKENEKWLATTLRSIGDAVIATDKNGLITFMNPVAEALMGWKLDEVLHKKLTEVFNVVNRNTRQPVENPVTRVMLVRNIVGLANHTILIARDGTEIPIDDSAAPIKDDTGEIIGVILVFRDVTQRVKAEEELQRAHDELEMRVNERTVQLRASVKELEEEISRRAAAEKALRASEQAVKGERKRFLDVLETLPAYVVLLTPDYHVPFDNRFFRERFGESNGRRCFDYLFKRTEPCEICETYTVLKTMKSHEWEWLGPDGRNYYIYDFPFIDTDGSTLILEMGIDITEQKQAQEALRNLNETLEQRVAERTVALSESREDLNRAQAVASVGSWRLNVQRDELVWSDETYRIFGIPPGTPLTYETFLSIVHPDDRECVDRKWKAAIRGEPYDIEHRIVVGETIKWVRELAELEFGKDGALLGGFGTAQEITERKKAEENLRDTLKRFELLAHTADGLLRSLQPQKVVEDLCRKVMEYLECNAFFNFLVDDEAGKLHLNACAGIPYEEARKIEWLDYGGAVCGCVARDGARIVAEHIPTTPDQRTELVESYGIKAYACHPLLGPAGRVIGTLSFGATSRETFSNEDLSLMKAVSDMVAVATIRIKNEQALRESEERYRRLSENLEETVKKQVAELRQAQTLAALGQMVSVVAHEIRNPLHTVNLGIDGLKKALQQADMEEVSVILEEISYGSKLMNSVVNDLLYYTRPVTLELSWWPIRNLVDEALGLIGHRLRNVSVQLELDQIKIFVDAQRLTRVLVNLMSNAADAMADGGKLRIYSQICKADGADLLRVCVSDSGCGIREDLMEKIYEPFFTTKTRGTGLGIPICRKLIEAHDGTLTVRSKVNEGTTVEITLPLHNSKKR
jgi:PAS domain S-box-containing protein